MEVPDSTEGQINGSQSELPMIMDNPPLSHHRYPAPATTGPGQDHQQLNHRGPYHGSTGRAGWQTGRQTSENASSVDRTYAAAAITGFRPLQLLPSLERG